MLKQVVITCGLLCFLPGLVLADRSYSYPYKGPATPHVKWGLPSKHAAPKILALVPGRVQCGNTSGDYCQPGMKERDVIELIQRFGFSLDTVQAATFWRATPVPGKAAFNRFKKLSNQKYDVIILANVFYGALDPEFRHNILKQVVQGAVLVCVGNTPHNIFQAANKLEVPEELLSGAGVWKSDLLKGSANERQAMSKLVKFFKVGKGLGVSVVYPGGKPGYTSLAVTPSLPYSQENAALYEYWSAWIGKIVQVATKSAGSVSILPTTDGNTLILRNKSEKPIHLSLRINIKNIRGELVDSQKLRTQLDSNASKNVAMQIPELANGKYYAEILADGPKFREGFACIAFDITNNPKILSAKLSTPYIELGQSVAVTIKTPNIADATVRAELVTADRRTVARKEQPCGKAEYKFDFKAEPSLDLSMASRVRVSLIKNGKLLDSCDLPLAVTRRQQKGFKFVVWGDDPGVLAYYAFKRMAEQAGVDGAISWRLQALMPNNISKAAYTMKIVPAIKKNGKYLPFSWNDNKAIDAFFARCLSGAQSVQGRQAGTMVYSLGDEIETESIDDSPACLEAYRLYLQKKYKSIAKLNEIWQSNYASFDQIDVLVPGDLKEEQAFKKGLYARWYDRYFFMRHSLTNILERFEPLVKKLDPKARSGFEGAGAFDKNPDIENLVKTTGFWVTYNNPAYEVIRGLTPKDYITGKWMGYAKTGPKLIFKAWDCVIGGADGLWWWRWDGVGKFHGLMQSNLSFWPAAREMLDDLKPLREGLGDWLVASDRADDGIMIMHSNLAVASSLCKDNAKFGEARSAHTSIRQILGVLGLGYRYITPTQIAQGDLAKKKTKVLILPKAYALDQDAATAIEKFVHAGGVLIADVRPGVYDEYCRPRQSGVLDKVFGVKHKIHGKAQVVTVKAIEKNRNFIYSAIADSSVQLAGAKADAKAGTIPLLCRNSYGKGKAFLSNGTWKFCGLLKGKALMSLHGYFLDAMKSAGVRQSVGLTFNNELQYGSPLIARWKSGKVEIVGVLNHLHGTITPKLSLSKAKYVYGIDPAGYIARGRQVAISVPPARARFFVLSDVPLKMVTKTHKLQATQGKPCEVQCKVTAKGSQALFAWLTDPEGNVMHWSKKTLLTKDGVAKYTWTPAYEDKQGQWKLNVRHLPTGKELSVPVDVEPNSTK